MNETDEEEWFEGISKRKEHEVVFAIMADGKHIGMIGIHQINRKDGTAITGTMIGNKEYWGKGYGTEAKMLLLDFAFNTMNLRKICSSVIAFNERSYKYSLKCGYIEEGRRKLQNFRHGKYWDEIFLAVFRDDWLPLWEKFKLDHNIVIP